MSARRRHIFYVYTLIQQDTFFLYTDDQYFNEGATSMIQWQRLFARKSTAAGWFTRASDETHNRPMSRLAQSHW